MDQKIKCSDCTDYELLLKRPLGVNADLLAAIKVKDTQLKMAHEQIHVLATMLKQISQHERKAQVHGWQTK